jgi:DNA-binding transcriptional regulator YdaS (Cro superfamily)
MNTRTTPEIREQIKLAIRAAGNQQALADVLGVTQQAVSSWLRGVRWMPVRHAVAIEALFHIPAAGLINPKKVLLRA